MPKRRRYQIVMSIIILFAVVFAGLYLFILQPALLSAKSSQNQQSDLAPSTSNAHPTVTVSPGATNPNATPTIIGVTTPTNTTDPNNPINNPTPATTPITGGGSGGGGGTSPLPPSTPTPTPTSLLPQTDANWSVSPTTSSSQNCWRQTNGATNPDYYTYFCRYSLTRGAASPAGNRSNWSVTTWSPVMSEPPSFGDLQPGQSVIVEMYAYASSCPMDSSYFYINIGSTPDDRPLAVFTVYFSCPQY